MRLNVAKALAYMQKSSFQYSSLKLNGYFICFFCFSFEKAS